MRRKRFTVEPGRHIYFDGQPFISVGREGDTTPATADRMAHLVVKALNRNAKLLRELKRETHATGGVSVRLPSTWED